MSKLIRALALLLCLAVTVPAAAFDSGAYADVQKGGSAPAADLSGADLTGVDTPFSITADAPFAAAFTDIQVVAGAADGADVVKCAQ